MGKIGIYIAILLGFTACGGSTPSDLEPVINNNFKDAKTVFYPSTDFKVSSIVVDKNGDVWYLRMNGFGQMKDRLKMFNVSDYCQ